MMERVKCDNCGFEQEKIVTSMMGGCNIKLTYACLHCKKIITDRRMLEKCPECNSKLVKTYKENFKDHYYTCPNCGKRKLKFYVQRFT